MAIADRVIAHRSIDEVSGCWNWTGAISPNGYGRIRVGAIPGGPADGGQRRMTYSHIASYEAFVGPVPQGLELDHLCRNTACCNPEHLEPVTHQENVFRAKGKTHCMRGHELTAENVYTFPSGRRNCRACRAARGGN